MPSEDNRPANMPDTSETYERAHPSKTPGLGEMGETDKDRGKQPETYADSRKNSNDPAELTAQETASQGDGVDPNDAKAHGDRAAAGDGEAEATGQVPEAKGGR